MIGGRFPGRVVGTRQRHSFLEGTRESLDIKRIDEHTGFGRYELGRPTDARRHDRAAAGHRLEQRLTERLNQARLGEDATLREQARNLVVRHAAEEAHAFASLQLRPQPPVPRKRERPVANAREGVGEPDDVLPLVEVRIADLEQPPG